MIRGSPVFITKPYLDYLGTFVDGKRILTLEDAVRKVIAEHKIRMDYIKQKVE